MTSCAVQRSASSKATDLRIQESTEVTARDSVVVELLDTLVEVTTITIDRNEQGDTLKQSVVTDRLRTRNRNRLRDVEVKVVEKIDTVYIERRDSVRVREFQGSGGSNRPSAFVSALKWIFWIIVSITVFIIIIKFFIFKV